MDEWTTQLDSGGQVDVICTDFAKAFDTVPHRRLLRKIKIYNINQGLILWIQDFLCSRKQSIGVNANFHLGFEALSLHCFKTQLELNYLCRLNSISPLLRNGRLAHPVYKDITRNLRIPRGRTTDLYNSMKLDSSMQIKFLLIIPNILYALFIFWTTWSLNVRLLSNVTPKSLMEFNFSKFYDVFPSIIWYWASSRVFRQ